MSVPHPPVIRKDAVIDRRGIMINFIVPAGDVTSHTITWKAESWWQSASTTTPGELTEYLITELPPNEKVSVWIYSTNDNGSSAWSDPVDFVTSRDCGQEGPPIPDISTELDVSAKVLYDILYTAELDAHNAKCGLVSNVVVLSLEEKDGEVHKRARVTPPIPESLQSLGKKVLGDFTLTYEEVSIKSLDKYEIKFKIENIPMVGQYTDCPKGSFTLVELGENRCRFEGFFDIRVNYPVIGYYIAQVIRNQAIRDITAMPHHALELLRSKGLAK